MDEKLTLMRSLVDQLKEASDAYYNGMAEIMTDFEWDAMFDRLKALEEETGVVMEDSPTMNVQADDTAGEKEAHEFAALSLAKTKKEEELVKWAEGKCIYVSWKLDGLTLVVTYDNGRLSKVVTRGDGHIGTNITHLAKGIHGIPEKIDEKGHLVIRGEAVISYEDFETFRVESGEDYANPRNLASGSLTLKDVKELERRNLHWIPFTLVYTEQDINSWGERMAYLSKLGFTVVDHERIEHPDAENVKASIAGWTKRVSDGYSYPVDGLVICYDDTAYAATGSVTGHHAVRAGYAFKWEDEAAETKLDHIEWSCAASTITPVAVFEPVELEGTTVKRASLCNISECERLGIGAAGTGIQVIKANKIIPKVIAVTEKVGELEVPETCPVCGAEAVRHISDVSGTVTLRCTNIQCPAKKLRRFTRFVSKPGMDIDGISEMTLSRFINAGWIHRNGDVFRLVSHVEEIAEMEGFGEKSAENIRASLEKARDVEDRKLLYALNIPLIGQDVAKKLLSSYSVQELVEKAKATDDPETFSAIDGIGPEKSKAFVEWFKDADNAADFEDLLTEIRIHETEKTETGQKCAGLTFVITGDVHHFKNRNELKAYIESQGGKVTGSVSKSTSFLINNDINSTSGKNKKARELNIPILSEDDFVSTYMEAE